MQTLNETESKAGALKTCGCDCVQCQTADTAGGDCHCGSAACFGEPSPVPQMPELEVIPKVRNVEVWVRIKKSSKYYHQGLTDPTDGKSKQRFFKLGYFTPIGRQLGTKLSRDSYVLHFNGNAYRIEDCEIFLRDAAKADNFVRLV